MAIIAIFYYREFPLKILSVYSRGVQIISNEVYLIYEKQRNKSFNKVFFYTLFEVYGPLFINTRNIPRRMKQEVCILYENLTIVHTYVNPFHSSTLNLFSKLLPLARVKENINCQIFFHCNIFLFTTMKAEKYSDSQAGHYSFLMLLEKYVAFFFSF